MRPARSFEAVRVLSASMMRILWKFFLPLMCSSMKRSMRGTEDCDSRPPETRSASGGTLLFWK